MKKTFSLFIACFMLAMLQAATVNVAPGDGTLRKAINEASVGDILVLTTGEYAETSSTIKVEKNITIQAAESAVPVLNLSKGIQTTAGLTLKGLKVNATDVSEIIRSKEGANPYDVTIDNCIFSAATGIFYKATGDAKNFIHKVEVSNSTFYRPTASTTTDRMFYVSNEEKSEGPLFTINHCTFYGGYSARGIYLAYIGGAQVSNSIFMAAGKGEEDQKSYCLYGANCKLSNSISFNAELYLNSGAQSEASGVSNPYFVDVEDANFQLFKNSPAVGKAKDGGNIGDQRWGVSDKEFDISSLPLENFVVKYPYSMAPTTTSVKILWELNNGDSLGVVKYGTDPANLTLSASSKNGMAIEGEGYVHVVELTGLKPFTTYYYQVGNNKVMLNHTGSTKTAPEKNTAFRIFTISDIHVNSCKNWSNMQDFICNLGCDLMMCNGDFVNNGNGRDWNDALFNPGKPFLSQTPIMSAPGNHETGDPNSYRYSTFYDYFWQFSHGYIDGNDEIKDPRGESYFSYDYGNAKIIAVNVNGDPSSPSHLKGSKQIEWVENQIKNASQDWILIFGHVGLTTSAYHGQWPPEGRDAWRAMFEKYQKEGKKIIYFCGDDHSFEHAYKDGVHYVRPGCGRNSNYKQVTSLKDAQYSMFFRSVSCYSTLDMSADGSELHLTTRDSVGTVFYEYTFKKNGEEIAPDLHFIAPMANVTTADSTRIQWFAFNPTGDAKLSLYYTDKNEAQGGTLIVDNLGLTPKDTRFYNWQTRGIADKKTYYIYGVVSTAQTTKAVLAPGAITLLKDTTAPAGPRLAGDIRNGKYFLGWENPTRPMLMKTMLQDFEDDMDRFEGTNDDEGNAVLSLASDRGGKVLKIDYTGLKDWGEGSAYYTFSEPRDLSQTNNLSFFMKGDGSAYDLRLFVKCDADYDGQEDDWWYSEEFNLSKTNWNEYSIDMSGFAGLDWHDNIAQKPELSSVTSIWFTVPTSTAGSGTIYLDNVSIFGWVNAAPDYVGTVIVRNEEHFPESSTDGVKVYEGTEESCYDETADPTKVYYYAAFAYDDLGNISGPEAQAQWLSSNLNPHASLTTITDNGRQVRKYMKDGHLYIQTPNKTFTLLGVEIK